MYPKLFSTLSFIFILSLLSSADLKAQNLLYFCEKYTDKEIGLSDRFTTGSITVMVKLDNPIYFTDVTVQADKYNCRTGKFEYFSSKPFTVDSNWDYMFFSGLNLSEAGIYRVFLLDPSGNTIVSALVETIRK